MQLKNYKRDSCVAVWSNSKRHGELLACASADPHNEKFYDLQILSVDPSDPSKNINVEGRSKFNSPFRCLAWGTFGEKDGKLAKGIIFGGMENGSYTLWNPAQIISKHQDIENEEQIDNQKSFLCAQEVDDEYPILCAEWNPLKNNFLAYGSTSLFIIDVARDLSAPDLMRLSENNPHEGTYITSLSWNKEVPNILASAGSDGLVALYDIKLNKSIFRFKDNFAGGNTRQVEIAWSKHISTHIAITLDDAKKNELQIWDLRNQKGPIVVIDKGHSKGINTMDWSQLDNDLILAASRDHRVLCWDQKQDETPLSVRQVESQIIKVAWSKALPSVYSITTVDGLSICSLDDKSMNNYVPKWLKAPVSATFNGNQSFIVYSEDKGSLNEYALNLKVPSQIEEQLLILEEVVMNENFDTLKDVDGETGEFWRLVSTKKHQEGDADIYDFLGFNKDKIVKEVEGYTGKKRESISQSMKALKKTKTKPSKADYIPVSDAADFFVSLSAEPVDKSSMIKNQDENEEANIKYEMMPRNFNWDVGRQKLIKQNMLIGNYEGAIDAALKCGRTSQALIIAYSIDQTTFNSTLKTFFTETTDNFISGILKHIAFKDAEELVNKYDLGKWRECVALIFSQSSADKRKNLLNLLAERILNEQSSSQQDKEAAIYCYILAEEFNKIVDIFYGQVTKHGQNTKSRKLKLVHLGTKLIAIFQTLTTNTSISVTFERMIRELALVCLQANKKVLSYSLFTKYVGKSSSKYIEYLIYNTKELEGYRNAKHQIISLPVMAKRQEKQPAKKVATGKQQIQHEEVPTNIRPNMKGPRPPVRTQAFNETEPETEPAREMPKHRQSTNQPPPPPSYPKQQTNPIKIHQSQQEKQKHVPPPPPTGHRKGPFQNYEQQQEQKPVQRVAIQQPPLNRSKNTPPPPPPHKSNQNANNSSFIEQHKNTSVHQNNPVSRPTFPGSRNTPPPPPPVKREKQPVEEQSYEAPQQRKVNNPPPSSSKTNLPPPPVKNITKSMPPPPPQKTQNYQQYDKEQQEVEYEQPQTQIPKTQYQLPPGNKKGFNPPPPPAKSFHKVESNQSFQQQDEMSASFTQNKKATMPAQRKVPPPPPPRRS